MLLWRLSSKNENGFQKRISYDYVLLKFSIVFILLGESFRQVLQKENSNRRGLDLDFSAFKQELEDIIVEDVSSNETIEIRIVEIEKQGL